MEYEYSPDFSYSKNTFDNMEEIAEHKKEIKQQKSELINSLVGKNVAKTGGFHPVTKKEEFYESKPFRLYDTQGYEISKKK